MSNEWFERGQLPPVGVEFEAYWPSDDVPKWCYFKCAYLSNQNAIFSDVNGKEYSYRPEYVKKDAKIRKFQTRREKAIEAAIEAMQPNPLTGTMALWFGKLYDAGLLRLPEDK